LYHICSFFDVRKLLCSYPWNTEIHILAVRGSNPAPVSRGTFYARFWRFLTKAWTDSMGWQVLRAIQAANPISNPMQRVERYQRIYRARCGVLLGTEAIQKQLNIDSTRQVYCADAICWIISEFAVRSAVIMADEGGLTTELCTTGCSLGYWPLTQASAVQTRDNLLEMSVDSEVSRVWFGKITPGRVILFNCMVIVLVSSSVAAASRTLRNRLKRLRKFSRQICFFTFVEGVDLKEYCNVPGWRNGLLKRPGCTACVCIKD